MCIGILLPSMSGQYMCVWYPQKPEESTEIPRIGVINSCDTMYVLRIGWIRVVLEKQLIPLNTEQSLQYEKCFSFFTLFKIFVQYLLVIHSQLFIESLELILLFPPTGNFANLYL